MKIKALVASAITAVALTCSGALAATLETINLGGSPTNQALTMKFDGLGTSDLLTVAPIGLAYVHQNSNGLGMNTWFVNDSNQLGVAETLGFFFSRDVKLHSLTFSAFDPSYENYTILVDVTGEPIDVTLGGNSNPFEFGMLVGDAFTVSAIGLNDSFRISSLTISEVPVPAAGVLLIGALGGLGALKRRRKAA